MLELGCAAGANLIPLAAAFPGSEFVGIDLSPVQIAAGRREVHSLALENLDLRVGDLAVLPAALGTFDFVLAHGVFSWVSRPVQEGLLRTVRACLSAQGAAFVSYSALPGAYPRQALGEMLRWRVRGETEPARRVELARRFAEFIASRATNRAPHAAALRRLVGELGGMSDAYVLHDYLSEVHEPVTLSTFVARAAEHQLQYLGDAQFHTMFSEELDAELRQEAADQVSFEQTLDFLTHRPFRTSLLCRAERELDRQLSWERLEGLHFSSRSVPADSQDGVTMFRTRAGETFGTDSPLVAQALTQLVSAWPRPIAFDALCTSARHAVDGQRATAADREVVGRNLLAAFAANQVELGTGDRMIAPGVTSQPRASSAARAQAASGAWATNLWHEPVALEPWMRALLPLLDGTRARAQLLAEIGSADLEVQLAQLAAAAFILR